MGIVPYLRYLRSFSSSASLQGFKPSPLSSMLFLGLLDTSKIGSISFNPVACITGDIFSLSFRRAKATGKQARRARHMRRWKALLAPRSLRACLRSPEKREKITLVMQAITPGQRLKVEFMKKKLY